MKTTVKRGAALARGHMRKVSTRSSNTSPPFAQEGRRWNIFSSAAKAGTNVLHLSRVVRMRHSSSVSWRGSRVKTFRRRDDPAGGGERSLGSVPPPVNVDWEKLLLFVYTSRDEGWRVLPGGLVYCSLCRLADNCPYKTFWGSGCRRRRFIWRGGHSSVDLWPSPPHPLTPRRNESCYPSWERNKTPRGVVNLFINQALNKRMA